MKKIGVLLPDSTTHHQIGYDFFFGLKKGVQQNISETISLVSVNIGFGIDGDLIFKEAEKLILNEDVSFLVAFADYPKVQKLVDFSEKLAIPLVLVGSGARYPKPEIHSRVWFLNLGELFSLSYLGANIKNNYPDSQISLQSNFYDGGYDMFDAFTKSYGNLDGKLGVINITSSKKNEFSIEPIKPFLSNGNSSQVILNILSAPCSGYFLDKIKFEEPDSNFFASSNFINELMQKRNNVEEIPVSFVGMSTWILGEDHTIDKRFTENFLTNKLRFNSPFTALGWEVSLFIQRILELNLSKEISDSDLEKLDQSLITAPLQGVRGKLRFHLSSRSFLADLKQIEISSNFIEVSDCPFDLALTIWEDVLQQTQEPQYPGWMNTYLCS